MITTLTIRVKVEWGSHPVEACDMSETGSYGQRRQSEVPTASQPASHTNRLGPGCTPLVRSNGQPCWEHLFCMRDPFHALSNQPSGARRPLRVSQSVSTVVGSGDEDGGGHVARH
eukprot:350955-Chlamydomonas_euryale.AAC.3